MTKQRNKLTIRGLLFTLVILMGALGRVPLTANAEADLDVQITGADGTPATVTLKDADGDGYYEIGTADELYVYAAAVNGGDNAINGKLTADIEVNKNVLASDGNLNADSSNFRVWTPIGPAGNGFTGTFDGAGHIISGLYINDDNTNYVGLFGHVGTDGRVQKVGVTDFYFGGSIDVGGIAGSNNGTITNCYTTGTVNGTRDVGGVVGYNSNTVASCYSAGNNYYPATYYVGGIVGYNSGSNSKVQNSFFNSDKALYSGKAVGVNSSGETLGTVDNVDGKDTKAFASGEVAYLLNGDQTELVFKQTLGTDAAPNFTGESVYKAYIGCAGTVYSNDEALKDINVEHLYNNLICAFCDKYESAIQNADGYYEIDNASKLFWFAEKVNDGDTGINGKLTADIVVNENVLVDGSLNGNNSNFLVWTPIGTFGAGFTGIFDGVGHTISGLYFNDINTSYVGLFGAVGTGGTVEKVGVTDSYFYGNRYVGGIAGQNDGTIRNCYNSGAIKGWGNGSISDYYYIGGVVGNNTSTVENCYNVGSVVSYGSASYAGGLVGSGTVINSYFIEGAYSSNNTGGGGGGGGGGGSDDAEDDTDSKTAEQFASGEVAYLLGSEWGQNLGENGDAYPVLGGVKVYFGYLSCADDADRIYTNDSTASETKPEHDVNNYIVNETDSTKHDGTCSICNAVVTEDHTSEKDENKATCKKQAVCDNCGVSYGEMDEDNHANEVTYSLTQDGTQHVATWSCCGVTVTENHSTTAEGDKAANCGSEAYCSVCDSKYGEVDKNNHDETVEYKNGFCPHCDIWEPAALKDGYYQIKNAGNLYWYADYVNTEDRTASAVLVADIDLEGKSDGTGRKWTPIGFTGEDSNNFRGVFDGQGYTITGLYVEGGRAGLGFFGEVRTGTVKNFTIYGDVVVNTEVDYVGGVIGSICGVNGETDLERNGAIIQNITSYVNLTAKAHGVGMIGGFVGYANHQSLIENCSWYGTFDAGIYRVDSGAGGFIGKIRENTSEVTIRNCAAYGTIKTNYAGNYNNTATIYMGGFLSFSNTNAQTTLENCLFAGKFERGENLTVEAQLAAFGTLSSIKRIESCYYLADDGLAAVHTGSEANADGIIAVTAEKLKSGEVAHLLQGEQTEQIWGQTIDTDSYPVLGGDAVYQVLNCKKEEVYSNTNENLDHQWDNDTCTVCGEVKTYAITIATTENGTVTAGVETATKGTTVTLSITPATGYCLTSLKVVDENDEEVPVENNSFVMPEASVTVIAVFAKDYGDFVIEGESEGWNVTDDVLTFTQSGAYTVSLADGKTETSQVIVVDAEEVTLTLNQITIKAPDGIDGNSEDAIYGTEGTSALTLNYDATLVLAGENTLIGGKGGCYSSLNDYYGYDGGAGISALDKNYNKNMVTVSGEGSLTARGGDGEDSYGYSGGDSGAGIDGSVTLYGGTVTVIGGTAGVDTAEGSGNGETGAGLTGTITAADGKMLKITAGASETSAEEKTVYSGEQYAEFAVCVAAMVGKSLSINGDIGVNFYLKLDSNITENATVKFILPNGEEEELKISEAGNKIDSESGAYKLSTAVAAAEMAETITVQVFTGDSNEAAEEFTYSVVGYAKTIFGDQEKYGNTVPLMQTMLNYGAMAQTYFNRNTENPANAILDEYGLSTDLSDISPNDLAQFEANIPENGLPEGISYAGTSLLLEAEVTLRHYFTLAEGATAPEVNNGWSWVARNGKYYAEKTGIVAAELDTMQSLTIGDWTMQYSPLSYVKKVLEAETETRAGAKNLMKALYYYNQAANTYFANQQ